MWQLNVSRGSKKERRGRSGFLPCSKSNDSQCFTPEEEEVRASHTRSLLTQRALVHVPWKSLGSPHGLTTLPLSSCANTDLLSSHTAQFPTPLSEQNSGWRRENMQMMADNTELNANGDKLFPT